jgi:hypothetical protein
MASNGVLMTEPVEFGACSSEFVGKEIIHFLDSLMGSGESLWDPMVEKISLVIQVIRSSVFLDSDLLHHYANSMLAVI